MREIKFRGKRVDNGEWVYGFYRQYPIYKPCRTCIDHINHFIDFDCFSEFVDPETVGQRVGLRDVNDKEIYEDDIVMWGHINTRENPIRKAVVKLFPALHFETFTETEFGCPYKFHYGNFMYRETGKYLEIIGNIHDNSDLIKPTE